MRIKRILMVDDEPDITYTLKTTLEDSRFFQVDTFNDAESALSKFRPGLYDLVLLDIKMPKMNGFQLCRKLRSIDYKIKMCFLTAADLGHYREKDSDIINNLGTDSFVTKPVDNKDIIGRLRSMIFGADQKNS
jgi:DNA-binding response OmpR family regulator